MRFPDLLFTAFKGVTMNGLRSFLTMLGIIIGVGSVILMTSLGGSVEQLILGQISSLGARSMVIFPGQEEGGGGPQHPGYDSLTFGDVEALKRLTTIRTVAPILFLNSTVSAGREEVSPQVMGTTVEYFQNQSIGLDRGRMFTPSDEEGAKEVALLGPDTAEDLFSNQDPVGQRVNILDRSFTVIGVLKPLGSQFFQNADERVYVPLETAQVLSRQTYVNFITLTAAGDIDLAFADIKSLLRQRHRIQNPEEDPEKDDFVVRSASQALDILSTVSLSLTLFLSAIAAISLVVGGIGIMNIMLVAVTERTREIGLRKAVGARGKDILLQFLLESVLLTGLGGVIGIVLGTLLAWIASLVLQRFISAYAFTLSLSSVLLAVGVAAGVGILFGLYPARRAAQMSPIEALRYE